MTSVAFDEQEVLKIVETAQQRIETCAQLGYHDYLRGGQNSLVINAYGVRGEWAVAKALGLDETPVFRNGVSFRADLKLRMGGKNYNVEVKSPLGRDRRLAITAHHDHPDIQADAYFVVWPLWQPPRDQLFTAIQDPVEVAGFVPRKHFQKHGHWRTLKEGKQWCLDPEHFKPLKALPVPELHWWPILEKNPYETTI